MKEQFVPYEIAKKLEEKGFDEECLAGYYVFGGNKEQGGDEQTEPELFMDGYDIDYREAELNMHAYYYCDAPLWQQVVDWFREKHGITIYASDRISMKDWCGTMLQQGQSLKFYPKETYYEALTKIIEEALKLI